jgi:hypothetical protein
VRPIVRCVSRPRERKRDLHVGIVRLRLQRGLSRVWLRMRQRHRSDRVWCLVHGVPDAAERQSAL